MDAVDPHRGDPVFAVQPVKVADPGAPNREGVGIIHDHQFPFSAVELGLAQARLREAATSVVVKPELAEPLPMASEGPGRIFCPRSLALCVLGGTQQIRSTHAYSMCGFRPRLAP